MVESLALDSYTEEDIEKLLNYGDELVKEKQEEIKKSLRMVVDDWAKIQKGYKQCRAPPKA
jgi:translation elongation factor EF-Tu-like GTPase